MELAFLISGSGKTQAGGHLVPGSAFEGAPGSFLLDAAPLLEKERDSRPQALIADSGHPGRLERTRARAGFAADDDPIDAAQVQVLQWANQRLQRQEFGLCAGAPQMIDAEGVILVFHADAHPDIFRPFDLRTEFLEPFGAFGQCIAVVIQLKGKHSLVLQEHQTS